ncbi:hypothetical protein CLF_110067 [Clonorchis sinensis]|uniref:Uncharacterized protein n=1 Tax=Clonorchis sinensis TaxID=79923 RepID=G7YK70_CLOSI|nr:hypothetical protein CLF_110067 [Clonorchis sinensis]
MVCETLGQRDIHKTVSMTKTSIFGAALYNRREFHYQMQWSHKNAIGFMMKPHRLSDKAIQDMKFEFLGTLFINNLGKRCTAIDGKQNLPYCSRLGWTSQLAHVTPTKTFGPIRRLIIVSASRTSYSDGSIRTSFGCVDCHRHQTVFDGILTLDSQTRTLSLGYRKENATCFHSGRPYDQRLQVKVSDDRRSFSAAKLWSLRPFNASGPTVFYRLGGIQRITLNYSADFCHSSRKCDVNDLILSSDYCTPLWTQSPTEE